MWRLDFRHLALVGLIMVMLVTPTSAVMAQEGQITHVVQPGEDIFSIGAHYGVSVPAIMLANKLPNLDLTVGQTLSIPPATPVDASVPSVPPSSAPQGPEVQEGATTHLVAPGENLFRISLRYGLSVQALAWANGLNNVHLIYVGQRLVIPNQSGAPVSQPPTPQPGPDVPSSPPPASAAGKEIVVVLHEQKVYAYENGQLVRSSLVSTGVARYPTRVGQFHVYAKYISTLMTGPGYYLPNVPYTMYYSGGYALHGTYWHNNFGHPMSHGCVNMLTSEARWLFEWAPVGTLVTVRA
jgi:lipoprotein-anchoring transpeptidase ErfK/SrfK